VIGFEVNRPRACKGTSFAPMQRTEAVCAGNGLISAKRFRTRWMNAARVTADAFSMPYSASQTRSALRATINRARPRINFCLQYCDSGHAVDG